MITIKNKQRQNIAILENAFDLGYLRRTNEIWTASFSLPLDDPKNTECEPLNYVEITDDSNGDYIGLFRIDPSDTVKEEQLNRVTYQCTHVLSTLLDDVLFLYHEALSLSTADTIKYLLDKQLVKNWQLGNVNIARYFSYKWESENLISALFSITKPFDVPVRWSFDTTVYPWKLNLTTWPSAPECEIRYAKNLRGIERKIDPSGIINRWYAVGYGEGVNTLTIEKVNPTGLPYVEDSASIAKYGVRADIFIDKSIEDANTLLSTVKAALNESKDPKITYRVNAADLTSISEDDVDRLKEGRMVRVTDPDFGTFTAPIVADSKADVTGQPYGIALEIANKVEELFGGQIELMKRQRINDVYAQGALSIDSHGFSDNADATHPAVIRFFLPNDLVNVNTLDLTFETAKFRAYSKATITTSTTTKTTSSGGGSTVTSSSGGGTTVTSSSGGGTTVTSSSGGGTTATSSNFIEAHLMSGVPENSVGTTNYGNHLHEVVVPGHDHTVTIANHSHSVTIGSHSHSVSIAEHSHNVSVPSHSHSVDIPGHGHDLDYGVYEHETLPTSVTVKVDGTAISGTALNRKSVDIIPYLAKDANGKVKRNEWHTVEITPNNLARINANVISRIFIQSRLGGNY
jgi:phage minor structural protein